MATETEPIPLSRDQIVEPYHLEGDAYAWGKVARVFTEPAFLEVYIENPAKDLVSLDIASSYPHYRQIMVGQHRQRMFNEARRIGGVFFYEFQEVRKNKVPFATTLDRDTFVALVKTLGPRKLPARQLLNAAIFEIMVDPPDSRDRNTETVSEHLLKRFMDSDEVIETVVEPDGRQGDPGNWVFLKPTHVKNIYPDIQAETLYQMLSSILEDRTPDFLKAATDYVAKYLIASESFRRVTFLSLDIKPFKQLVEDAKNAFPPKMQKTLFFKSAQDGRRHIQADILSLPLKDGSIDFLSSAEGWPYHFRDFGMKGNRKIAQKLANSLKPGGKAAFFPWKMDQNTPYSQEILRTVVKDWENVGFAVERESRTKKEVLDLMTDRELMLAHHSPLFKQTGLVTTLILSRPDLVAA